MSLMLRDEKPLASPDEGEELAMVPSELPTFHTDAQSLVGPSPSAQKVLPPTSYVPLSMDDELLLAGKPLPPSPTSSSSKASSGFARMGMEGAAPSEFQKAWRTRRGEDKAPEDLLKAGMRARRWK